MGLFLNCREVVQHIDAHDRPTGLGGRLRFNLHIMICGACHNYKKFSDFLSAQAKLLVKTISQEKIKRVNEQLLQRVTMSPPNHDQ